MNQDELKRAVAKAAVDYALPKLGKSDILGIGTGSTANFFIDYIADYKDDFRACVSSSEASTKRLQQHGIEVLELNEVGDFSVYVDGADESNDRFSRGRPGFRPESAPTVLNMSPECSLSGPPSVRAGEASNSEEFHGHMMHNGEELSGKWLNSSPL